MASARTFRASPCISPPETPCNGPLWIEIHQKHSLAMPGQPGPQVDGGHRFATAALLVCNAYRRHVRFLPSARIVLAFCRQMILYIHNVSARLCQGFSLEIWPIAGIMPAI